MLQFPSSSQINSCLQMGLGKQELTILLRIKIILPNYLHQNVLTLALFFFPAFQIPNKLDIMEHCFFIEQAITSYFQSSCTQF